MGKISTAIAISLRGGSAKFDRCAHKKITETEPTKDFGFLVTATCPVTEDKGMEPIRPTRTRTRPEIFGARRDLADVVGGLLCSGCDLYKLSPQELAEVKLKKATLEKQAAQERAVAVAIDAQLDRTEFEERLSRTALIGEMEAIGKLTPQEADMFRAEVLGHQPPQIGGGSSTI